MSKPTKSIRALLRGLRNANYKVAAHTDHERKTVSTSDANALTRQGYGVLVEDTKDFRVGGKHVKYLIITAQGRDLVDNGFEPITHTLPVLYKNSLDVVPWYKGLSPSQRDKLERMLVTAVRNGTSEERFVEVMSLFDDAQSFFDFMR